jgi:hypothetical protein
MFQPVEADVTHDLFMRLQKDNAVLKHLAARLQLADGETLVTQRTGTRCATACNAIAICDKKA